MALAETEKILMYLFSGDSLEGTEEPLRVYYACYLALKQNQDSRFLAVLHSAGELLETQVSKLRDEKSRRMFIENVPWRLAIHRELNGSGSTTKDKSLMEGQPGQDRN